MVNIAHVLKEVDHFVWGPVLLLLLIGTGIYLTIALKGLQFRYLLYALKIAFSRSDKNAQGDISHFQSLMTSLAATIGIGNIAGVATAIAIGGVGALFWMWVTALIGMSTKYAEAILAVKYRQKDHKNEMAGGPMYYLKYGLNQKWLAAAFAIFGSLAALGTGNMVQSHSVTDSIQSLYHIDSWIIGLVLAIITLMVLVGGVKSIGRVSTFFVPLMALIYLGGGLIILALSIDKIPDAFFAIISSAFNGQAATGGFLGSTLAMSLQMGVSRGVFSNEAGLGTASIAAAAAKTDHPARQALISMTGTFLATLVVCTITGFVITVTGVLGSVDGDGALLNGGPLTMKAFDALLPFGDIIVTIGIILFAYSTIIGWAYYGEKCFEFLFDEKKVVYYRAIYIAAVFLGSTLSLDVVWSLADIFNGLMAFPNLVGVLCLSPVVVRETLAFERVFQEEKTAQATLL